MGRSSVPGAGHTAAALGDIGRAGRDPAEETAGQVVGLGTTAVHRHYTKLAAFLEIVLRREKLTLVVAGVDHSPAVRSGSRRVLEVHSRIVAVVVAAGHSGPVAVAGIADIAGRSPPTVASGILADLVPVTRMMEQVTRMMEHRTGCLAGTVGCTGLGYTDRRDRTFWS